MFLKLREQVGTAGLIVAIVALVAALGGGAYAATGGLTGKQKTEVKKIAKTEAKKFATAGPAGPPGAPGAKGAAGTNGTNGTPGTNGTSVTSEEFSVAGKEGHCVGTGGSKFTSASGSTFACNGEEGEEGEQGVEGSPWVAGGTLPSGKSEAGAWSVGKAPAKSFALWTPISFTIPLAASVSVHFVNTAGEEVEESAGIGPATVCLGSAAAPTAPPGVLCVYEQIGSGALLLFEKGENPEIGGPTAGKSGVNLQFFAEPEGTARGTWIVTAQ